VNDLYVDRLFGFIADQTIRILVSVMVISIHQYMLYAALYNNSKQILLDKMDCEVEQDGSNTLSAKKQSLPALLCAFNFN